MPSRRSASAGWQFRRIGQTDRQGRPRSAAGRLQARRRRDRSVPAPGRCRPRSSPWCRRTCRRRERCAGFRRQVVEHDPHGAGARGAAMLHPRHDLLADIAALVEIDAVQPVHVGLVRERVAIHEVEAAARHAERDAMRLIGGAVDEVGADEMRRLSAPVPPAPGCASRARRCADRRRSRSGLIAGSPPHAASTPRLSDRFSTVDLGAQLVEAELGRRGPSASARGQSIRKPPPWPAGASVIRKSVVILPCGVSSAPNRPRPGRASVDVGGDEAVEEVAGILAADLDHAPIGKKRCFHAENLLRAC